MQNAVYEDFIARLDLLEARKSEAKAKYEELSRLASDLRRELDAFAGSEAVDKAVAAYRAKDPLFSL